MGERVPVFSHETKTRDFLMSALLCLFLGATRGVVLKCNKVCRWQLYKERGSFVHEASEKASASLF